MVPNYISKAVSLQLMRIFNFSFLILVKDLILDSDRYVKLNFFKLKLQKKFSVGKVGRVN